MTSQETYNKSRRIASNTVVLFVRMFILTVINLYAVKLVLKGLGENGYGIFTTVASFVAITSLLNVVLALSIQRFYSFYLGKQDYKQLNDIFSASLNIVFILALCAIIVLETGGLWFVHTQLTIPAEQMDATLGVYQFSIFTLVVSMLQIPYTAAVFAHEDMTTYTWVSTIECLLKFAAAWSISYAFLNSLVFYTAGLFITAIIILGLYIIIGRYKYEECHYHKTTNRKLYKELLSFSGWTLFGSAANTGMIQGNIILINVFFGPLVSAAFGIAQQINNAFNTLCNTMVLAFRPPMIKAYAEERYDYLDKLFSVSNKFIYYLLLMVAVPIIVEMNTILDFWLDSPSAEMVLFSRLIIVYVICMAMNSPITIIMQASGHIKEYHLPVESTAMTCLPITWILFKIGFPAYYVFVSMICICCIAHIVRLWCLKRYYSHFSVRQYFGSFAIPALLITLLCFVNAFFVNRDIEAPFLRLLSVTVSISVLIATITYLIGLNKQEKLLLKDFVKKFFINKVCRK